MVLAVAFTRDGKKLASGGWDKTIRLWEPATGKELRTLEGHFSPVSTVVFLADGETLGSGSWDASIRLWNTATGKELRQMQGHRGPIPSIALSPDGETLASGSWDRTVRLWDVAKGRELRPTEGHHHGLWSVAISPDGKQIASGDEKGEVRLWDSATSKEDRLLRNMIGGGERGLVDRLDFSPDGESLRAASWGYTLYHWKTATGKPLGERRYKGISPILTSDGKFVVSSGDGTVFLQEAATAKVIREFKNQKQTVNVAVSPDGKFLAAGSPGQDGTVVLWELATGAERCRCKGAYDRVGPLTFSLDGKKLAGTTTRSGIFTPQSPVHLWDAATGREVRQFQVQGHALSLVFSSDGRTLASGGGDKTVRLWEVATGKERRRFEGHEGIVHAVALSPDGSRLASASADTTALIWDVTGLEQPGRAPDGKLSAKQLQALWTDLAGDDAAKAYRAMWILARYPKQSVPLLREHVPVARALDAETRKQVERWLAELDSDEPAVRNRAGVELEKRIVTVEAMLRNALTRRPSLEQRKRIERLLERLEREQVTLGRALEALEHAAAPESRQLLETLAAGEPEAWLTREAKAALHRVQARQDKQ
jgi:WD40 repeat protein